MIQRIEVRRVKDAFGRDLPRAVIFSEGNFISNQVGLDREAGLILLIDVKQEHGETGVAEVAYLPTWVHAYQLSGQQRYRVVAVEQAMSDYEAGRDPLMTPGDYQRLKQVWADTTARAAGSPEVQLFRIGMPLSVAGKS